jgi:hypothetical protein
MSGEKKVVEGFDILFKDDFSIVDSEISKRIALPKPCISDLSELLIVHNDSFFTLSDKSSSKDYMTFYKMTYGITRLGLIQDFETKYFTDNIVKISDLKKEFIMNSVSIPPNLKNKVPDLGEQVGKEIVKKIEKAYPKPNSKSGSIFSQLGYNSILLLDKKLYQLITIPDLFDKYKKSFEPNFFKDLIKSSGSSTPEEISDFISKNRGNIHPIAFPVIRDKIWCNDKSSKIFFNGRYLIPDYNGHTDNLEDTYTLMLERKVKLDAAQDFQRGGII